MKWNFLKRCWPFPIREAHRPRRRKSQPAKPRVQLWLEELESRTVPTTITRTSASIFYNDFGVNPALTSHYVAYQITNTDGVNYADVWATIGNFTATVGPPVVTLAANAASAIDLGPLAAGQTKTAFFYLGSSGTTTVNQTHTVSLFKGLPTSGNLLTSQNFTFTSVQDTIQSNSNTVSSVVVSPSTPTIGGTFTITVTGQTGTIGSPPVLDFTPAAYSLWRADALQLIGTTITFSGGSTGTFTDTLAIPPGSITSSSNYTAVYTFQVVGPTATASLVSPVAYIESGANVKHTTTGNFGTLPPVQPPALARPTVSTTPTPATVPLGTTSVTLTDTALLANGFRPTGTITFRLVAPGGGTVDTETVAVNGNGMYTTPTGFTLPNTGTVTGTYQWNATYTGDTNNNAASDVNDVTERVTVSAAHPTLTTTPSPAAVTLGTGSVTLKDTANLGNGFRPTGTLTFKLFVNGGSTPVDTETVSVNGNGTYTTPTGFTLPTTGTATATYTWTATYTGDGNNTAANDQGGVTEQVTVSKASPTVVTAANPTGTISLGTTATTLNDAAVLSGGYNATGTLLFTLKQGSTTVFTQTDTVTGNGTYTTAGFTLPTTATAIGTYTWTVAYSGDANNNGANDQGGTAEQVTVNKASPTVMTTANPTGTISLSTTATTLNDSAVLSGGYNATGTLLFTLKQGSTTVFTQTDTVAGNGTYTTAGFTLPTTGTATGTYTWTVAYSGDANNNAANDQGGSAEQVTVTNASPTVMTTANPTGTITLGLTATTLNDAAVLSGGYNATGTLLFTLKQGSTTVFTQTDTVAGDGTYTTAGFTLPTTGTATGTYTWTVAYSGDANNNAANDQGGPTEQVTVTKASPTVVTAANPTGTISLGTTSPTLNDSAVLSGGSNPTGTLLFTLKQGSTTAFTQTDTVTGNGTYTTAGFTLPTTGTATGTYTWTVAYSGDASNNAANDQGGAAEQVTVSAASPTLTTTPTPNTVTPGVTLKDTAFVAGGFHPTGTITFTLFFNGGSTPVDTETVTVNGNGSYTTPTGFTPGTASGTYQWNAVYSGDANNNAVSDLNDPAERVTATAPPSRSAPPPSRPQSRWAQAP
jgi:hypothetical protein